MDYTALLTAVDFTDTITGIQGAAAAMLTVIISLVGWRFFRRVMGA